MTSAVRSGRATRSAMAVGAATSSRRAADPATAIAQSSAWVPDVDAGPSPDVAPSLFGPARTTLAAAPEPGLIIPSWLRSPWTWASLGGVAVAVVFCIVFLLIRSGPSATQAAGPRQILAPSQPLVASATVPDAPPAPAPAPAPRLASHGSRTIDLLPLIDPVRHSLGGNWRKDNGDLVSDHSSRAKIGIPYAPPAEYDFKIEFTRVGVDNCVAQMFTHRKPAVLILGGWKGTASGFQQIHGRSANINSTGVFNLSWQAGRRHTSVIKVRKGGIEAWLDGQRITAYPTDGADLSNRDWPIENQALGVGSEVSPTVFHRIELIENPQ